MMKLMWTISEFYYVRISIVVWRTNGLSRIENIDAEAGLKLCELIESIDNASYPIVLDFQGIVAITDGSMSSFFEKVIGQKKEVHFVNCDPVKTRIRNLYDEFNSNGNSCSLSDFESRIIIHFGGYKLKQLSTELKDTIDSKLDEIIGEYVKQCFIPNDLSKRIFKPLSSTPILATGQFDAARIISDPNEFTLVCIRLADKVRELIQENTLLNATLLSVSLRASPFANAISILLNIEMRTIDHLGPFQKVWDFDSLNRYGMPNTNYIFVGDFIVGGTEMKLAHLFAKYCQSDLKHAVAIGSVLAPSRFTRYNVSPLIIVKDLTDDCQYELFE